MRDGRYGIGFVKISAAADEKGIALALTRWRYFYVDIFMLCLWRWIGNVVKAAIFTEMRSASIALAGWRYLADGNGFMLARPIGFFENEKRSESR